MTKTLDSRVSENLKIELYDQDLPATRTAQLAKERILFCDIETSGLLWHSHRIALCQLCTPDKQVYLVKMSPQVPHNLSRLMGTPSIRKVFHHAMFDLRFMSHHWQVQPRNIGCTKIASKILDPLKPKHTLKLLLEEHLGRNIPKLEACSDWFCSSLTQSQMLYAVEDVIYLQDLYEKLKSKLAVAGLWELTEECFQHIPTRVQLEIKGYPDIFGY